MSIQPSGFTAILVHLDMLSAESLQKIFHTEKERYFRELFDLLRIPSVSTDPGFAEDCHRCADWLREHLSGMGFTAQTIETPSLPVVFAHTEIDPDLPTVLFYGHYDVQPPDPVEAWASPAFEPEVRNGRIYARGAQDNKGQLFYVLKAIEHLSQAGKLTSNLKIILEGEEESGSDGLAHILPKSKELFKADTLLVCDSQAMSNGAPAIVMSLRGAIAVNVRLVGPKYDLHSGKHGGIAPNPAMALARLLATIHDNDGSIAVTRFTDDVPDFEPEDRDRLNRAPFDPVEYEREIGVPPIGGETAYTPLERGSMRPTIEVNGLLSGYTGAGIKTIIPAEASAKISCRLVPGQDPEGAMQSLICHLEKHAPPGLTLEFDSKTTLGGGIRIDSEAASVQVALEALTTVTEHDPVRFWYGSSIPIVADLVEHLGVTPVMTGFGSEEGRIHAPNESFSLEQFERGFLFAARFLSAARNR